jgi:hypothetical protein
MFVRADAYRNAVALLRDLPPYDQCRHIVQMVYDGSLTHQQGKELLHALVDHEIDAPEQRLWLQPGDRATASAPGSAAPDAHPSPYR